MNYIAVSESVRGKGVGAGLLRGALALLIDRPGVGGQFELDVFRENSAAMSWYERLGLRETGEFKWLDCGLAHSRAARGARTESMSLRCSNLPHAAAMHAAYGFSEMVVEGGGRSYHVGRLGTGWYRLRDGAAVEDPELMNLLAKCGPRRRICVLSRDAKLIAGAQVLVEGQSMAAPTHDVLERLET